jgi:hypothetical protein
MQTLLAILIVLLAMGYLAWLWVPRGRHATSAGDAGSASGCNTCSGCSGCGQ